MKKKIALAAAAVSLMFAGSASAADLVARPYAKAPVPFVAPIYNWAGFYVGINGGGGSSHKCWDLYNAVGVPLPLTIANGCHNATGGTVGGQLGYRWQASNWVFGLEAQGNWANFRGSNSLLIAPIVTNRSTVDTFGLFTGQIGYSWNNVLLYVKGGAAVARDKYEGILTGTGLVGDRATETRWGGAVGTGLEVGFAPNWSVGVEYNHMFMGTRDNLFTSTQPPVGIITRGERIQQDIDVVTARINYRFGGPVVARY